MLQEKYSDEIILTEDEDLFPNVGNGKYKRLCVKVLYIRDGEGVHVWVDKAALATKIFDNVFINLPS